MKKIIKVCPYLVAFIVGCFALYGSQKVVDRALTEIAKRVHAISEKQKPVTPDSNVNAMARNADDTESKPAYMVKPETAEQPDIVLQLAKAIKHLMKKAPKRILYRDQAARIEMAEYIDQAAFEESLDPFLILEIAYREGSLKTDIEGGKGETTTMQVHGVAKDRCEQANFDLELLSDQIHCGAYYLRILADDCGGIVCALNAYASGSFAPKDSVIKNSIGRIAMAAELAHIGKE